MTDEDIPEDVRTFLHDHIESFEELAALALLVRDPARAWDEEQIAQRVHSSEEEASRALEELCARGFVVLEIANDTRTFRYGAKAPSSETIERLASLYEERPLEIMRIMSANAIDRVRTRMAKSFANAFVVRKKK